MNNSAAIKQLLQQQIFAAVGLCATGTTAAVADFPNEAQLTPQTIPLHRLSADTGVVYRSAIAFKLAPLWQQSALDIAERLTASFTTPSQDSPSQICLDFSIEVAIPGWINFRLSDRSLAAWLQQLIQTPPQTHQKQRSNSPKDTPNLFPVQYAHARCCSLLRLAHWQNLIQLRDINFSRRDCQLIEPNPIPWLNDDQEMNIAQVSFRLVRPAERSLIDQLLDAQDALGEPGSINWVKRASALSDAFEQFYSRCRIWGEVKTQTPQMARARLGLVEVTRSSLRSLLQDQLGASAPIEL